MSTQGEDHKVTVHTNDGQKSVVWVTGGVAREYEDLAFTAKNVILVEVVPPPGRVI